MTYLRPVDAPISDTFEGHQKRTPPSVEPGVDYACAYGTPILAPANGTVIAIKTTNSTATGRYVTLKLDDGRTTRDLHLSRIDVKWGERVWAGKPLGLSGGSAKGDDWGVGPHLHRTLWAGDAWYTRFLDFEDYVTTGSPAGQEEDDMSWKEQLSDDLTAGDMLKSMYWQNTDGIPGVKKDGTQVARLKRIEARVAAGNAAVKALAEAKGFDAAPILAAIEDVAERPLSLSDEQLELLAAKINTDPAEIKAAIREAFAEAFA